MLTHTDIAARHAADAAARKAGAIAAYEAARKAMPAAIAAANSGADRDAAWKAADRLRNAERLVLVFIDRETYGAMNDRIVAEIQAEQAARR